MSEEKPPREWGRKRGRRSKAEELGAVKERRELLARMPRLDRRADEQSIMRYLQVITEGVVLALLSVREADALHKIAAAALRAIRQRRSSAEMQELEAMYDDLKGQLSAVLKQAGSERTH